MIQPGPFRTLFAAGLALLAGGAIAKPLFGTGPLCRDGKGLAKPCSPAVRQTWAAEHAPHPARAADGVSAEPATSTAQPAHRPLFGTGRLCHDGKGLGKPC